VPDNWGYPTNWWERGELVEDVIGMSVAAAPAGTYELRAGWYNVDTAKRLSVTSKSVEALPDNSALLATIRR
jgi:hypothetical protein